MRHAQTDAVGRVLAGRAPGFGLNSEGEAQADKLAASFAGEAVNSVFTSPRQRAGQTAERIARVIGCAVETAAALDEVDFGGWTGQAFETLAHAPGWGAWNGLRSFSPTPEGETMLQVQARAVAMLQALHAERGGGSFVLVSHADVIRCLVAYALGMAIDLMQRIEISTASVSVVALGDGWLRVEGVNRRASGP